MGKLKPTKPLLIMLYGMPGSGKTFISRQLCEHIAAAHVQGDRIRDELFENPTYSREENHIVAGLMAYMTGEFLQAGISVIYDTNAMRLNQRRALRNLAVKSGALPIMIWIQIDPESAFKRATRRDHRKNDDKYAQDIDSTTFRELLGGMQNPDITESYLVLSGKHVFNTQKNAVIRYLAEKRLIEIDSTSTQISKPGLINIVPHPAAGRVDLSRRNISIQ